MIDAPRSSRKIGRVVVMRPLIVSASVFALPTGK
jgi:hypothetical protein